MNEGLYALIGGVVGSIITIIITKVFDFLQIGKQHNLDLKKEFFLRKLIVFEKTVSYWNMAHSSITNVAALIQSANGEGGFFEEEQGKAMLNKLEQSIENVYSSTQDIAGAIDLYIDLKHDEVEVEMTQQFYDLLAALTLTISDLTFAYSAMENARDKESGDILQEAIDEYSKKLQATVQELFQLSQNIRRKYLSLIDVLRTQLKSYE